METAESPSKAEKPSKAEALPSAEKAGENSSVQELPPLTLRNVVGDLLRGVSFLIYDPSANRVVIPLLVCASSVICKVIVRKVPYTEIDFSTYLQQVEMVNEGEIDYSLISGDSGPIVYPAGFVQVYQALYWLTEGGVYMHRAQFAFGYLFSATTAVTCAVYSMAAALPPWPLYLLLCSKRLYSIYVLRMFNDCFTTAGMVAVVLLLQQASYWSQHLSGTMMFLLCAVAADIYSMALSVKMNVLLYFPALAIVVFFLQGERIVHTLLVLAVVPLVQVVIGWRFLLPLFWDPQACALRRTYLSTAFDFSRQFLYKWTVNWRFLSEATFLSADFANALLVGHVCVLTIFVFMCFLRPSVTGKPYSVFVRDALRLSYTTSPQNLLVSAQYGPQTILLIFSVTNLIGVLHARSLHYQFLSWYCWSVPFLLYAAGCGPFVGTLIFVAHEYCWNVYPSTPLSSSMLVLILTGILISVLHSRLWSPTQSQARK